MTGIIPSRHFTIRPLSGKPSMAGIAFCKAASRPSNESAVGSAPNASFQKAKIQTIDTKVLINLNSPNLNIATHLK